MAGRSRDRWAGLAFEQKRGNAQVMAEAEAVVKRVEAANERQKRIITRLTGQLMAVRDTCTCGAAERQRQAAGNPDGEE